MVIIYVHVIAVVPDGRVLLRRPIKRWEATISSAVTSLSDVESTAKIAVKKTLGIDVATSVTSGKTKLETLVERYDEKSKTYTIVYLVRPKSGTMLKCNKFCALKALTFEELVEETGYDDHLTERTLYVMDILKDLRAWG